jgi:deoxycytidylate deaminase
MEKKIFFSLETGPLGGSRGTVYAYHTPLVGCTVKTITTDIQTVDSVYSKTIHQDMEEDHITKAARDAGVEKHSCQIELRGAHLKLVHYVPTGSPV